MAFPDLEQSKATVLNSLTSESGQRTYDAELHRLVSYPIRSVAASETVVMTHANSNGFVFGAYWGPPHSYRRASSGFTRDARHAGR